MKIRVGSRPSALALSQVREVMALLPAVDYETVTIKTEGDRDKESPLSFVERIGFFTGDIEAALLEGRIDIAVHSAKDLEDVQHRGLMIAALTKSASRHECLVSRGDLSLNDLPAGAVVGTSSRKRRSDVLRFRGDLVVKDIRGDIDERLEKLDRGLYDAVIIAHAALVRLGYTHRIAEIIPGDIIEPHPLQGRLAIQVRRDRADLIEMVRCIDAG